MLILTEMTQKPWSIRRRTFLAMVGASTAIAGCSSVTPWRSDRHHPTERPTMNPEKVYRISKNYHVGPERKRPPASDAEGTIWEVVDTESTAIRRTLSDGERWFTLNVEAGPPSATGEYHLTSEDGFEEIQRVIDRTDGNVVIRLAPGTYVGSELTLDHGVILAGSGRNATTLKLEDGANTDLLTTPNPPTENVMECTLRDITFDGNKANNRKGNVVYGAFWNSRFVDCEFHSAPESGFWLAGSEASTDDNQFRGCQFIDNRGTGLRGGANKVSYPAVGVARVDTNWFGHNGGPAITARGNSWKISDSKFYDNALTGGATIELDRCSYSSVTNSDIYSARADRDLIAVSASTGVNSIGNQVKNNDLRGEYRSAVRCLADGNGVLALQVHGNTFQSGGDARSGIVAREERGSFAHCSFKDNTFVGVFTGAKVTLLPGWQRAANV
ncbi:MAG TPA: right-handed parallel beta-helix repeat-containing protein, partial [Halococcus sp.]|nr:right-handed parallel beta-helix repeat-containing protein [Halococcus sp.]